MKSKNRINSKDKNLQPKTPDKLFRVKIKDIFDRETIITANTSVLPKSYYFNEYPLSIRDAETLLKYASKSTWLREPYKNKNRDKFILMVLRTIIKGNQHSFHCHVSFSKANIMAISNAISKDSLFIKFYLPRLLPSKHRTIYENELYLDIRSNLKITRVEDQNEFEQACFFFFKKGILHLNSAFSNFCLKNFFPNDSMLRLKFYILTKSQDHISDLSCANHGYILFVTYLQYKTKERFPTEVEQIILASGKEIRDQYMTYLHDLVNTES